MSDIHSVLVPPGKGRAERITDHIFSVASKGRGKQREAAMAAIYEAFRGGWTSQPQEELSRRLFSIDNA